MPARQRGSPRRARYSNPLYPEVPWLTGGQRFPAATPPPQTEPGRMQYRSYLPRISATGTRQTYAPPGAPGAAQTLAHVPMLTQMREAPQPGAGLYRNQLTPARAFGRWGYAMGHVLDPEAYQQETGRQYTPPGGAQLGTAPGAGGGGGGGGGRGYAPAPAGVDPNWYRQFQEEHGGQTPEEYYAQTGEGLPHALADEEWARGFAEMYGRPPNEYDWNAHWYSSRTGATWEEREEWRIRRIARQEAQRAAPQEQRPPVYQPPEIIWR